VKRFLAVIVLWSLFVALAHAEHRLASQRNIVFDRIGTEDGLTQALASSFAQDAEGFMWIGTQEGLNRYDGFTFRQYYHLSDQDSSISHDSIWSLFLASNEKLWVGTSEGLNRYDSHSDSFELVRLKTDLSEEDTIYDLVEGGGELWVASSGGLYSLDQNGRVQNYRILTDIPVAIAIRAVELSKSGDGLWVGSERNGLYYFDFSKKTFVAWELDQLGNSLLTDLEIRDLELDTSNNLWVATFNGGLSRIDVATLNAYHFSIDLDNPKALATNRIRSLLQDREGNVWVGTDIGLHLYSGENEFTRFEHDLTNPRSISENTIHSMFQDKGGVIWIGTYNGVNKWNAEVELFPFFKRPPRSLDVSPSTNVTSFGEDSNGNVWAGTFSGLLKWDVTKGELVSMSPAEMGLSDQRVMSLGASGSDLWIGTMNGGVNVLKADGTVELYQKGTTRSSLSSNAITGFFEDSRGRMWVTTWGGGVNLHLGEGVFRRYPDGESEGQLFSDLRAHDIVEVAPDEFWIATDGGGVVLLEPASGVTSFLQKGPNKLTSDNIITLLRTKLGVWVGSVDKGLSYYDVASKKITNYSKQDGLASDAIYGLLEDEEEKIWISGAKGLSVFDPKVGKFISFNTTHGLQSDDFNSGAYAKLSDGSLAFGGINGFNVFYPTQIRQNSYVPPVVLTNFKLFNQNYDLGISLQQAESVELAYDDSVFSIGFASLDYTAPDQNRYRYQLEGFDKRWVIHEGSPEVTYTNLDAGDYRFRVQGSNNDDVWNEVGVTLGIRVNPAPWLTWWAYCLYLLATALGIFALFRYNTDRLQREAERKYSGQLQLYIESLEEASDSILIADSSGTLIYANNTIVEGLNKTPSEVIGESLWQVLFEDTGDVELARKALLTEGRFHGEVQLRSQRASKVVHEVTIAAVQQSSSNELAYVGISRDITDRKVTEQQLEGYRKNLEILVEERTKALQKEISENKAIQVDLAQSLQEKELLIKEVHHRVKNNMQVISSLLSIQAEGAGDEVYSNLLNESQQRIKSMALIHETLYQSKDLLKIDFQEYIETLTTSLSRSYSVPGVSVHVDVHVDNVLLDLETAVPCGLVINELVSNSLKHAFHGKEGIGMIDIDFVINDSHYDLRIADNGVGLPDDFDPAKNVSMGMEIVSILTSQLEGNLTARSDGGAIFEIKFPRTINA
jgi:PAS domain S-box-containing protein